MANRRTRLNAAKTAARPTSTDGRVIYAIGDIHGRLDLLGPLLVQIRKDAARAPMTCKPVLVLAGDYVDRGDSSKGVIDRILAFASEAAFELRALKGNHEDALLRFLGDASYGPFWLRHGGRETLASYGVAAPPMSVPLDDWTKTRDAFEQALPAEHRAFIERLELMAVYGDFVFVHAGLRPGVPLREQSELDLMWIRDDFLEATGPFEKIVVHGHSPEADAFLGIHRIGIDTGAYATGLLTAVRLENEDRRLLQSSTPSLRRPFAAAAGGRFAARSKQFKMNWVHAPAPERLKTPVEA